MIKDINFNEEYYCNYETEVPDDDDVELNDTLNSFFRELWEASDQGKHSLSSEEFFKIYEDFDDEEGHADTIDEFLSDALYDSDVVTDRDLEKAYERKIISLKVGECEENGAQRYIMMHFEMTESPYCNWQKCYHDGDCEFALEDPNKVDIDVKTIEWVETQVRNLTLGSGGTIKLNDVLDILQKARS